MNIPPQIVELILTRYRAAAAEMASAVQFEKDMRAHYQTVIPFPASRSGGAA